jgi:hypothetical protein
MKFHYLVSFGLPDVLADDSQREKMRRMLGRFLERACDEVLPHNVAGAKRANGDPPATYTATVDPIPAGTVVPVLRAGSESEPGALNRWASWLAKQPQHVVVLVFAWFLLGVGVGFLLRN